MSNKEWLLKPTPFAPQGQSYLLPGNTPLQTKLKTSTSSFHSANYCSSSSPPQTLETGGDGSCPAARALNHVMRAVTGPPLIKGQTNRTPHNFERASNYLTSSLLHLICKGGTWQELFRPLSTRHCDLLYTEQKTFPAVQNAASHLTQLRARPPITGELLTARPSLAETWPTSLKFNSCSQVKITPQPHLTGRWPK